MQQTQNIEANIRHQFVSSLMEYFKIEEDINLRAHINDLVRHIDRTQYREFFRRLSSGNMPYKNSFEKVAAVAATFETETLELIFNDVKRQSKYFYDVMYELHKMLILAHNDELKVRAAFSNIRFDKLKDKNSNKLLFSPKDLAVLALLGASWVYDHISFDKSLFLEHVEQAYRQETLREQQHSKDQKMKSLAKEHALIAYKSVLEH